ncbi:MAG: recombinase family protein [Pseudomonadota bacterium]|nr:recombinase family protein [Pseudomonadota bacterium]
MSGEWAHKIKAEHLCRDAWLYIRQSTVRQVFENTESTRRQYALRQRAIALGWPTERIHVIDTDLGHSGAERDREGFQQLVTEVSLGRAGIVMGLEVSRLARNSMDWHRLLEICALSETLILDEDGIYDPGHFNDRLLLGLKGTMSEAELHVLHARLHGGVLNAARRGELKMRLPIGLTYDDEDHPILDPDQQIRGALRLLFETFERCGSATATVKTFRDQGLKFPTRLHAGLGKGRILWGEMRHSQVLRILHNPRYAGAFVYGRSRTRKGIDGHSHVQKLGRDQWQIVLPDTHAGYITWETFEANQQRLRDNAQAHGEERRKGPPREGVALLQGLVLCGKCGTRMSVRYTSLGQQLAPNYLCQRHGIEHGRPICQQVPGAGIDEAIGRLLLEVLTPGNLQVALAIEQELRARVQEADALRRQQVERARYEVDLARRRYHRVDPDNRLVADVLEAEWNEKLRALQTAQDDYERQSQRDQQCLNEKQKASILALAKDFPQVWNDQATPQRERKRLLRLLIEDVTLLKAKQIHVHVRFRGGKTRSLNLPLPQSSWQLRQTDQRVIDEIDRLLEHYTDRQIAERLNEQGLLSGWKHVFHHGIIARLRRDYHLKSRYERLREAGMLTKEEMAQRLNIQPSTVKRWRQQGKLKAHAYSERSEYLYEPPGDNPPQKYQWQHSRKREKEPFVSDSTVEV